MNENFKITAITPARYASSRFPAKPLADICGKPMIWWVYSQAKKVSLAGFDGFSKRTKNYYDKYQQFNLSHENISKTTKAIIQELSKFREKIEVDFITHSTYSK